MNRKSLTAAFAFAALMYGVPTQAGVTAPALSDVTNQVTAAIDADNSQTLAIVEQAASENPDLGVEIAVAAINATDATGEMIVAIVEATALGLPSEVQAPFIESMAGLYPDVGADLIALIPATGPAGDNNVYLAGFPSTTDAAGRIFLGEEPGFLGELSFDPTVKDEVKGGGTGGGGGGSGGGGGGGRPSKPITR